MFVIMHSHRQDIYPCYKKFPRVQLCYLSSNWPDKKNLTFCGTVFLLTVNAPIQQESVPTKQLQDPIKKVVPDQWCLFEVIERAMKLPEITQVQTEFLKTFLEPACIFPC